MAMKFTRQRVLLLALAGGLLLGGGGVCAMMTMAPPADLDLSLDKLGDQGRYHISVASELSPVTIGTMHTWTVSVTTPDGAPVSGAKVAMDGGMPQHGHGLPTTPRTLRETAPGQYLVGGMKFSMPGWWTLTVDVDGAVGADKATFNLVL